MFFDYRLFWKKVRDFPKKVGEVLRNLRLFNYNSPTFSSYISEFLENP
ncbi:hypothetical protein HMPREF9999_02089 [Alloprevotella sp. oral taxon 473 str. F0040]|nr:hypothetical protein HMPREF9999_02089 [Alloprevotella sp. oral taxon 473 str. F0040]